MSLRAGTIVAPLPVEVMLFPTIGEAPLALPAQRRHGAVGVNPIPWINRPTWQQAVEIQGHRKLKGGKTKGGSKKKGAKTVVFPAAAAA